MFDVCFFISYLTYARCQFGIYRLNRYRMRYYWDLFWNYKRIPFLSFYFLTFHLFTLLSNRNISVKSYWVSLFYWWIVESTLAVKLSNVEILLSGLCSRESIKTSQFFSLILCVFATTHHVHTNTDMCSGTREFQDLTLTNGWRLIIILKVACWRRAHTTAC